MAGNNPGNGNRQRNFSVASNTSTSSFKDNAPANQRTTDNIPLDTRRSARQTRPHASTPNETRDRARVPSMSSCLPRDPGRLMLGFESFSSSQQMLDAHSDVQEQFRKWFENGIPICSNHVPSNCGEPTPNIIRAELANSDPHHVLESRARKQQEAQQRLLQLQELIQNVSLDLELNPFQQHHDDKLKSKNTGLDFLRNVPSNPVHSQRATTIPRINVPRQTYKSPQHPLPISGNGSSIHPQYSPQNNLSHDPLLSPKRYSTSSQVNGSLIDVFGRSDPSFDSSNEEVDDNHLDGEDNENLSQAPTPHVLQPEINPTRNGVRVSPHFLERIEHQLDRNNTMCEQIIAEQRRLALVTESLLSAVSNMQTGNNRQSAFRNPSGFSMSGLPINSTWNDGSCDYQVLAHAVNQCCILIAQLQRDITAIQLGLEPGAISAEGVTGRGAEAHPSAFREPKARTTVPTFECPSMDRFDPEVTLNNRVPPGTRTNNYWDNFRSYSRQNLLSSSAQAPSNVNTSTEHQHAVPSADFPSQLPRNNPIPNGIHDDASARQPRTDVSQVQRRTKRKVNKGQRQVEIGVHCPPHADNRALAYGLLSVRSAVNNAGPPIEVNNVGRNLNPQNFSDPGAPSGPAISAAAAVATQQPPADVSSSNNTKAVKDSAINYSGARPKENRRPHETNLSAANVNLLTEQETLEKAQGLETAIRNALAEHVAPPQFVSQLLQLLQKLNSDPLRQRALNALEECVTEDNHSVHHQSELFKAFNSVAAHHRDLTPSLLETFLNAIQPPDEIEQEEMEGAAAVAPSHSHPSDNVLIIREALSPYLYRRLSQVQDAIGDALNKLEFDQLTHGREVAASAPAGSEVPKAVGRDDELADADQSCDLSCDGAVGAVARRDEPEAGVYLDEVPTRLMAVLAPPIWSSNRQSPAPNQASPPEDEGSRSASNGQRSSAQRTETDSATKIWFAEDG